MNNYSSHFQIIIMFVSSPGLFYIFRYFDESSNQIQLKSSTGNCYDTNQA